MRAILLAGGLSLIFTLVGTRYALRVLASHGYGQLIRDDGPTTHHTKRGTPTMGGLVIVLAMSGACMASGLFGVLVPVLLRRAGADPATASSIFLTTGTDIAGMGLMLALATILIP